MTYETITTETQGRIGVLTLNRPHVLNAFNQALMAETKIAMAAFSADPAILAIIVRGAGRAFSAGFDMKESATRDLSDINDRLASTRTNFDFIMQFWDCPKPTIAAVHGFCLAGAFEVALACDFTVAAEGTRMGEPEVRFGAGIVALLLPWMTTPKLAKELLLTGTDQLDAARAHAMGLVNYVVPAGQEFERAFSLAQNVVASAPLSVQLTKRAINRSYETAGMREALLAALDVDLMIGMAGNPEKAEFSRIRAEQGLKAAIAWRDAKFA
ncbi:MAG: enoyl-CoA hydratase/isomerase family protein [Acidisphaera sp.]|nr:enoyl-CoA hydratase/isomerase family protein [Acidisphaera sp.]